MEYYCQSTPLLLARKDEFRVGKFLNNLRYFQVPVAIKGLKNPIDFQCSLFWERDVMPPERNPNVTTDQNQWMINSYQYQCHIICTLLEHKPWLGGPVLKAICNVIDKTDGVELKGLQIYSKTSDFLHVDTDWMPKQNPAGLFTGETYDLTNYVQTWYNGEYFPYKQYFPDINLTYTIENPDLLEIDENNIIKANKIGTTKVNVKTLYQNTFDTSTDFYITVY
jgi:hypothetical protein